MAVSFGDIGMFFDAANEQAVLSAGDKVQGNLEKTKGAYDKFGETVGKVQGQLGFLQGQLSGISVIQGLGSGSGYIAQNIYGDSAQSSTGTGQTLQALAGPGFGFGGAFAMQAIGTKVGGVVGGLLGGPVGAFLGFTIGAVAGEVVSPIIGQIGDGIQSSIGAAYTAARDAIRGYEDQAPKEFSSQFNDLRRAIIEGRVAGSLQNLETVAKIADSDIKYLSLYEENKRAFQFLKKQIEDQKKKAEDEAFIKKSEDQGIFIRRREDIETRAKEQAEQFTGIGRTFYEVATEEKEKGSIFPFSMSVARTVGRTFNAFSSNFQFSREFEKKGFYDAWTGARDLVLFTDRPQDIIQYDLEQQYRKQLDIRNAAIEETLTQTATMSEKQVNMLKDLYGN